MRQRLPSLQYENAQNIKFFGAEVPSPAVNRNQPHSKINAEFRSVNFRQMFVWRRPPKCCANAGQQFAHSKWFYNVIVCSGIKSNDLVLFGISDRYHDDRAIEGQSNFPAGFEAA